MLLLRIIGIFLICNTVQAEMEGHVVGGEEVSIEKYPHSAFLDILCASGDTTAWSCGSSIINQHFTLTAAHCLEHCTKDGYISISVGHEHRYRGVLSSAFKIKTHKEFSNSRLYADISLVRLKTPVKFGHKVQRVILMKKPPREHVAYVAGWGLIDENYKLESNWLKHAMQPLWSDEDCRLVLGNIPHTSICAGTSDGENYAAVGDSGSALVIRGNIQIGIVSFKVPHITRSLIAYTNVSLYIDWIRESTAAMICG